MSQYSSYFDILLFCSVPWTLQTQIPFYQTMSGVVWLMLSSTILGLCRAAHVSEYRKWEILNCGTEVSGTHTQYEKTTNSQTAKHRQCFSLVMCRGPKTAGQMCVCSKIFTIDTNWMDSRYVEDLIRSWLIENVFVFVVAWSQQQRKIDWFLKGRPSCALFPLLSGLSLWGSSVQLQCCPLSTWVKCKPVFYY